MNILYIKKLWVINSDFYTLNKAMSNKTKNLHIRTNYDK